MPEFEELEIVIYVDPAIKDGKRNDYSAITVLGQHRKTKQMYVIDGNIYKLLPDDLFKEAIEKIKIYSPEKVGFEVNQAQSYMKQTFEEELWQHKIYTTVDEVNSRGNNHERIISLEPEIKKGYILFNRENISYNNQAKDYNKFAKNDDAPDIKDVQNHIKNELKFSSRPEHLDAFYECIEGWWFDRVIKHLLFEEFSLIIKDEIIYKINDLHEQFHLDNLPIDFDNEIVLNEEDLSEGKKVFIEQLKLITVSNKRIQMAINDYYRAYQQRSKWVRDDLIYIDELEKYEARLVNEWERKFEIMKEELEYIDYNKNDDKTRLGRKLYNWIDTEAEINIRKKCTEPFVMRGSFHMLSNELKVG